MGILSPGAMSSVTTAMCSEPPFLGSIFTVHVTPGRVRHSRCSPSSAARIRGVGLVTEIDCDCSAEVCRATRAPQYPIEKTPIANRQDRKTPPGLILAPARIALADDSSFPVLHC